MEHLAASFNAISEIAQESIYFARNRAGTTAQKTTNILLPLQPSPWAPFISDPAIIVPPALELRGELSRQR